MTRDGAIRVASSAPAAFWIVDLTQPPPVEQRAWLSEEERVRASRFRDPHDAVRYRAAHCALRALIAAATGIAAEELAFRTGAFGKPAIADLAGFDFNLSYGGDVALVGLATGARIGVDIERVRDIDDCDELAASYFSAIENAVLATTEPGPERARAFLTGWTRKEACVKAVGTGLAMAPASFTSGLGPGETRVALPSSAEVRGPPESALVGSIAVGDAHVAAWTLLATGP